MAVSFEAFFWAIATQESGGNYKAVGPQTKYGHAYGKYQVLAPNVAPWTKKYYGKALTAQQFLNNPQAQEAVARGQLQSYYSKYGPQGAAAMWYSGQPDPSKTYGNPPVYKYVSSVMGHAGGYSGQSTPYSGGGSGGGTVPAVPKLDEDELMEQYGLSAALINSSKELKKLFNQAVSGGWSAAKFQASLKNSKWWKSQSSTLRKYITTRATDPATFKQNWGAAQYKVNALAVTVGLGNQISKGKSSKLLKAAIYNSLALGWSDARIKDWLGTKATTHGGIMWGEAGQAFDKMHQLAYLNGMRYSQDWYKKNAVAVASGKTTMETLEAQIRKSSAARFSAFGAQILAGQDALDLAAPYIKSMATLLELPETDVDLFDKHIYGAMNGSKAGANFPLWEFENQVRNDPRWRKTNNARESMMSVARQVAKDFGLAY
ncbi:transglycosylase SLT domain-containing protein [Streptomyces sp. NBC_00490]|uniref:transglycosylase SLT domain-containing protein n=1 Tax=Streptomyces sp. NBC_00490 TaxID=2903657 RepID=UPI002E17F397